MKINLLAFNTLVDYGGSKDLLSKKEGERLS